VSAQLYKCQLLINYPNRTYTWIQCSQFYCLEITGLEVLLYFIIMATVYMHLLLLLQHSWLIFFPKANNYELSDLLFFIKSYKSPHPHFDINNYVSMKESASTRSSLSGKLVHCISTTNSNRHFYFCRLPRLWKSLPSVDLN